MKRRKRSSGGASLDSLLDTMTNVVGILVIMLTVTQLGVGEAVERIKEALPEITDEDMDRSRKQVEDLESLLKLEKEQLQTVKDLTQQKKNANLNEQKALIDKLKKELEKLKEIQINIVALKKQISERDQQVKSIEKTIVEKETELAEIKAKLAKTPDPGPTPDAKIVNLPNPRDAPKEAKPIEYVCRGGRVIHVDIPLLQNIALKAIAQSRLVTAQSQAVDCDKLVKLFQNRNVGNRDWRIRLKPAGGVPYLVLELRKGRGETSERLRKSSALFRNQIQKVNPQLFYLNFRVWSDSYDTYLVAREYTTQRGVLAGWVALDSNSEFRVPLGGNLKLTCQGYVAPPATPKAAAPDLPPPTQRKLPGNKID
ncbi:MAG: hypothetical protein K0U86_01810 [Planctomycetes bacterium]|nr:hypothetical protein [Planctomycetota bacterium]MCH9723622.1 hypothetical protein [Planctomycetota bacterium]MCH9778440.1 hypothetical protein [Planctomycetota bacterium]MCH9790535.1 hypothetical protein [Planctomycetota bacterium]MDF1744592.1 hypothetical protein [Gimesia sp.]